MKSFPNTQEVMSDNEPEVEVVDNEPEVEVVDDEPEVEVVDMSL